VGTLPDRASSRRGSCQPATSVPAQRSYSPAEDLAVISKVLGHADYGTTLKVYAHLDPQRAKAAAGRIDAALGRTLPALEDMAT